MGPISMSVILTEWFWISSVSHLLEFRVRGQLVAQMTSRSSVSGRLACFYKGQNSLQTDSSEGAG